MLGNRGCKLPYFSRPPDVSDLVFHPGLRHYSRLNTRPRAWKRCTSQYPESQLKLFRNRFTSHPQLLMHLSDAKNVFSRQLPNMGAGYITRLVFDMEAETVVILHGGKVTAGICSRHFPAENFIEIVFLAVEEDHRLCGYGRLIMNFLKSVLQTHEIYDLITCADNDAVNYFKKQGFNAKEILMDPKRWVGCIKDYEGVTLVHCRIEPDIDYMKLSEVIKKQFELYTKQTGEGVLKPPKEFDFVWPGYKERPTFISIPIPKLLKNARASTPPDNYDSKCEKIRAKIIKILNVMKNDQNYGSTFIRPVTEEIAKDYFKQITSPMDFLTIEKRLLKFPDYYKNPRLFAYDINLMCSNCQKYNAAETVYHKHAIEALMAFKQLYCTEFPEYPCNDLYE